MQEICMTENSDQPMSTEQLTYPDSYRYINYNQPHINYALTTIPHNNYNNYRIYSCIAMINIVGTCTPHKNQDIHGKNTGLFRELLKTFPSFSLISYQTGCFGTYLGWCEVIFEGH